MYMARGLPPAPVPSTLADTCAAGWFPPQQLGCMVLENKTSPCIPHQAQSLL